MARVVVAVLLVSVLLTMAGLPEASAKDTTAGACMLGGVVLAVVGLESGGFGTRETSVPILGLDGRITYETADMPYAKDQNTGLIAAGGALFVYGAVRSIANRHANTASLIGSDELSHLVIDISRSDHSARIGWRWQF